MSASQLKVGCFMEGLPILHPAALCVLSVVATAIACTATLITSATALAIASQTNTCSLAILLIIFHVCLNETLLLTPCNESHILPKR